MRSNIRQMAEHYNVGYDELIELIEHAVNNMEQYKNINAGVLLTLKLLIKEKVSSKKETRAAPERTVDLWAVLKNYFYDRAVTAIKPRKGSKFNDLIVSLSGQDGSKFRELILLQKDGESILMRMISELNDASLESVFSSLIISHPDISTEYIYLLDNLCRELKINIEQKFLWQTGLRFLVRKKGTPFTGKEFLDHIITEISKKNQVNKTNILEHLIGAKISAEAKTPGAIEIYANLTSIFISEISRNNSVVTGRRFKEILDLLSQQANGKGIDKALFIRLKKLAVKYIQLNPAVSLEILIAYPEKDTLRKLLPYILDNHLTNLLVKNAKKEKSSILLSVQQRLGELNINSKTLALTSFFEENLFWIQCIYMPYSIIQDLASKNFSNLFLKNWQGLYPVSLHEQFYLAIGKQRTDNKVYPAGITEGIQKQPKPDKRTLLKDKISNQAEIERAVKG